MIEMLGIVLRIPMSSIAWCEAPSLAGVEIGVEIWEKGRVLKEMESARKREQLKREREFDKELNGI